jgi:hypothetical protein
MGSKQPSPHRRFRESVPEVVALPHVADPRKELIFPKLFPKLFPWANFSADEDFSEESEERAAGTQLLS